ncbi:Alpha/Beta hydrolase protein [Immersiella caudata]|uniref:Alpha/Beta hydrolase protein n=1 Tax=Immersiella caudata TaxID=314043 RepID=A0AA39X322_9PEZI|nr:Alpha/Beta hydrolase protein [Immersiella caudata]
MFPSFTYKHLTWLRPSRPLHPLPPSVSRTFLPTPSGDIEVLHASPPSPTTQNPLFFVHGGMGGAWVWLEYLQFFSARGIPCYAVSMRGHGDSWCPSFLRLTYGTTKRMLADDVLAGLRWAMEREGGREVVLVGHSSGGGLSQFILSEREVRVKGYVLMGAVPGYGSLGVYMNWFRLDPWFTFRMIFHLWHPNSPLSHPALTRRVFFSEELDGEYVERFQEKASPYESFLWIMGMRKTFVNPQTVLSQISSWGRSRQSMMILRGEVDKIMPKDEMDKLAGFYRKAFSGLVAQKKLDVEDTDVQPISGDGGQDNAGHGVRISMVPKAGHHMQNDITWEAGAQKLLDFYNQLG